jgi:uncharacterized membrane protein
MPMSNADLMHQAREALKGKWGLAVVGYLFFLFITGVLNLIPIVGPLANLIIVGPLILGLALFFLGIGRGQEVEFSLIFNGFQRFLDALGTFLFMVLFIFLWSLLLFIPGIIAALSYSQTFFLMVDQPDLKGREALKESKRLMKGNQWKLFCLFWRFFGWFLLGMLTLGIGFLWIMPYLQTTLARFYEDIRWGVGTAADNESKVKSAVPPSPSPQGPQSGNIPRPAQPPKSSQPAPVPEPPKTPVNPRARVCLRCHSTITDSKAQTCPECGFRIMDVQGSSQQTKPPDPSSPPFRPTPKAVSPASTVPPQPMDLDATIQIRLPRLTSLSPEGGKEIFELRLPVIKIGRQTDNDLAFPLEKTISGKHCEIYRQGNEYFIKDLASTNGTVVNGQKVGESRLKEDDQIKLGDAIFHFTWK